MAAKSKMAKRLRNRSTDAERLVWSRLRAHRLLGFKFKRQCPVGHYIVDFLCQDARLVIEVDGGQHLGSEQDMHRDRRLNEEGFRVLRFWNNEVLTNIDGVTQAIATALNEPVLSITSLDRRTSEAHLSTMK